MNEPRDYNCAGETREMTVLFADIKDFSTLSQTLRAEDLKQLLHGFLTPMAEVIFEHRGTIDKYVGDMIMAFWGAPIEDPHHARHAVNAALAMLERVKALQQAFEADGLPRIDIGVGLNTGLMHVGDMGSQNRRACTVLGDEVNLASRLKGLTRHYGVPVVMGETTFDKVCDDYLCRELDLLKVKARPRPVHVYQPVELKCQAAEDLSEELRRYHNALERYRAQDWRAARALFEQLQRDYGADTVFDMYLQRIEWFMSHPPGEDWDGVYERRSH